MGSAFGVILSVTVLVLDVLAIMDCVSSSKSTGMKILWIILVILLPLVGLILYFLIGRK